MPNPSELERQRDEHGPIKAGVVFERRPELPAGEATEAALRQRVAELEAENARLRLQRHDENTFALSLSAGPSPERQRVAELERLLAEKDRLIASHAERIDAQAELLRQRAEAVPPGQEQSPASSR